MCGGPPVLRIVGLVFLVLALVALLLGYIAPFWVRIPVDESLDQPQQTTAQPLAGGGQFDQPVIGQVVAADDDDRLDDENEEEEEEEEEDEDEGRMQSNWMKTTRSPAAPVVTLSASTQQAPGGGDQMSTSETASSAAQGIVQSISTVLTNGTYWGLWAMCHSNLTCECFAENDFKMEREFPDWHKAVQGLFGIGLLVLLVALLTASFHVCCCRCCRQSFVISTVVGSLVASGLILVTVALLVYAGFTAVQYRVEIIGSRVFEWAFFVPIGGVGSALIAAILFLVDGRRTTVDSDGDQEETAKMV